MSGTTSNARRRQAAGGGACGAGSDPAGPLVHKFPTTKSLVRLTFLISTASPSNAQSLGQEDRKSGEGGYMSVPVELRRKCEQQQSRGNCRKHVSVRSRIEGDDFYHPDCRHYLVAFAVSVGARKQGSVWPRPIPSPTE